MLFISSVFSYRQIHDLSVTEIAAPLRAFPSNQHQEGEDVPSGSQSCQAPAAWPPVSPFLIDPFALNMETHTLAFRMQSTCIKENH